MDIKAQLLRFVPQTKEEAQVRKKMLAAWEGHGKTLLCRENEQAHFTASALLLNPAMDKALMVHHNLFHTFTWPGGHADGEEKLLYTAIREAREETGVQQVYPLSAGILSLDILQVPAHSKNGKAVPAHIHYSVAYGLIVPEKQPVFVKPDENSAVRWIAVQDLRNYCAEAHMLVLYEKLHRRMKALQAYKKSLYRKLPEALLQWYKENARQLDWRRDTQPYHVWLSEIMLQQTRVEAVKGYYARFLEAFPTIEDLAQAREDTLFKYWEGLGYYNRARNLQKAAKKIVRDYGGVFPSSYMDIASLPGVGPYTAGAIASICFEQPRAAVDGNVLRVLSRVTEQFIEVDAPQVKKKMAQILESVYPLGQCGSFTQSLMELGATICLPGGNPKCACCPARNFCLAYASGSQQMLPVKKPKRARKTEQKTVFLLLCGNDIAVCQRESSGLLAGLWQLPNVQGALTEEEAVQTAENWGSGEITLEKVLHYRHVFTHIQWDMTCYCMCCTQKAPDFTWATMEQVRQKYALPTAFRIFLE